MPPFDIKRIEEMEASYDALLQAMAEIEQGCAAEAASRKAALQPEIDRLAAYSPRTGYTRYWSVSRKWDRVTNQEFEVPKYRKPDISE